MPTTMSLVRLNIKGISYSQTQNGAYALILSEEDGDRKLPIVIGAFEAQSIAIALENDIRPPRPLTHDLFKTFADRYGILVKQVIIHKLVDGVFYSSIIAEREGGEEILDARTSDAIALALRFNAPIFTYKDILNQAGIHLKTSPASDPEHADQDGAIARLMDQEEAEIPMSKTYKKHSLKELKELLSKAISQEDYETAAKLRDELSQRNQ
jgi:bifunctional DNase/RNase